MRPIGVFAFVAIALASQAVEACSCAWHGSPCRAFDETAAVFIGRALEINPVMDEGYEQRLVRLEILQALKGVSGNRIEVVTGRGGGDCGYTFRRGDTYLVYAHRRDGAKRLYTGICSRTQALSDATEDLEYFKA